LSRLVQGQYCIVVGPPVAGAVAQDARTARPRTVYVRSYPSMPRNRTEVTARSLLSRLGCWEEVKPWRSNSSSQRLKGRSGSEKHSSRLSVHMIQILMPLRNRVIRLAVTLVVRERSTIGQFLKWRQRGPLVGQLRGFASSEQRWLRRRSLRSSPFKSHTGPRLLTSVFATG